MVKGKEIKDIESVHPLLRQVSIPYKGVVLTAYPFKVKENLDTVTRNDIKNIMQKNNYTN